MKPNMFCVLVLIGLAITLPLAANEAGFSNDTTNTKPTFVNWVQSWFRRTVQNAGKACCNTKLRFVILVILFSTIVCLIYIDKL